ncbi:unnamed protein product [Rotaria sp. Silwood2]|nr:unnamed protein product [Rotaria sp. Silwood2]CAF4180347.1 unnamed protein product [Rotaria sp. Silwood2]CAF4444799.1 unnamed protein product [Rotaria sp. Silwood2]
MGANESATVKVNFNRSNAFYFGGEKITGNISFQNVQNKVTVEEILLELIGELGYTTQETRWRRNMKGGSHKEHYTEYHHETFLKIPVSVVRSAHGKKKLTLRAGSHSWPFELLLPDCLPPTLVPSSPEQAYVKYYARIVLDNPWSSPDAAPIYSLIIFPRVNLLQMRATQELVEFTNHNRKKVELKGCLLRGGILAGQYILIHVDLQNPKQCQIKRIEATFIQHRQIASIRDQQIIFHSNLPGIDKFQETNLKQNFDLAVPPGYLAPTYVFTATDSNALFSIFIHYELVLVVKTNGIFTDFQVNIPVFVGTDSVPDEQHQQQLNDQFKTSTNGGSLFDMNDLPPSYAMATRNELKKC